MNKYLILFLFLIFIPFNTVFAQMKVSTPSAKVTKINTILDKLIEHDLQLFLKLDKLFDKLQTNIIKAKASGKNTKEVETLLSDSRVKLADARVRLNEAKTLMSNARTRSDYTAIKNKLTNIKTDLTAIRKNIAKIISQLKEFNSNSEATKSAINR